MTSNVKPLTLGFFKIKSDVNHSYNSYGIPISLVSFVFIFVLYRFRASLVVLCSFHFLLNV